MTSFELMQWTFLAIAVAIAALCCAFPVVVYAVVYFDKKTEKILDRRKLKEQS
jgi:hypothetical protein